MRLKELYTIINQALELLIYNRSDVVVNGQTYTNLSFANALRSGILLLEETELFANTIDVLKDSQIFLMSGEDVVITHQEDSVLSKAIQQLRSQALSVKGLLEKLISKENSNAVYIRLADVKDFKDLSKAADAFDKVLSNTIINSDVQGEIHIASVENGSIWLEVLLGTSIAVGILGKLAHSAALVYQQIQLGKQMSASARARGAVSESLNNFAEAQKVMLDMLVETEAKHMYEENYKANDPEQLERLKYSIKLLSEEMVKGAKVLPSPNLDNDTKKLFPPFDKLLGLESSIKKIKANNFNEDAEEEH